MALGRGDIVIQSNIFGNSKSITIHNALYIPESQLQIISTASFRELPFDALFSGDNCIVFDEKQSPILVFCYKAQSRLFC